MATVTGLTADRMLAIEAASVVDGDVIGDNLILTKHDGSQINAGNVRGPAGPQGPVGSDLSVLSAIPVLDVGLANQIRAGRQLGPADFNAVGLSAPLGLWNLSDLTDVSGNGRNLLNKGAVPFTSGINGSANTAALFTGSTAQALYISDTGANDPFRIKTGSWGCWFRTAKRGTTQTIINKASGGTAADYGIQITTANVAQMLGSYDGNTWAFVTPGIGDVADDRWHFVVATFDGSIARFYVDGVWEGVGYTSGIIVSGGGPFNIGGRNADGAAAAGEPFYGRIDEAFVTADVLNGDQIRNLYCAKLAHTLGVAPTRLSLNIRRRRKGAALVSSDFPTQPLRLHNFSAGSLGDEGSGNVPLVSNPGSGSIVSTAGADGTPGNGYSFSGAHSGLSSTDTGLPSGTATVSHGAWFKTPLPGGTKVIEGWGSGANDVKIYIGADTIRSPSGATDDLIGPFVVDGQWHFAVAVADNAASDGIKRKLYLDGRLVASSTVFNTIALGGANRFRIGANPDGTLPHVGQIDGVFVYPGALTFEQIIALYAKGVQAHPPSPKVVGEHVEAMNTTSVYCIFDQLGPQDLIDLRAAA
ncbi:MAG TPA: LamG domain-containing protein [Ktedonobacteraceae bacterium]|jgi:hypothetical protein